MTCVKSILTNALAESREVIGLLNQLLDDRHPPPSAFLMIF